MVAITASAAIDLARANQAIAADPGLSIFVTANAGSGKTTTLVNRVARLLLKRVQPGEILCVTYTKAAAAEMQARLFEKLGHWAVADNETLARSLAELDGRDPAVLTQKDLSDARRLFARALETPGGLKIQTIHAFCEKLLRRFPLEAGVTPGFRVLEDQAAVRLSRNAREDLARHALRVGNADPVGRAYEQFAVGLNFNAFTELLAMIEVQRESLGRYFEHVLSGFAPSPRELAGAGEQQAIDVAEDFIRYISPQEWRDAAASLDGGLKTDTETAARMRQALENWTFEGIGPVFVTQQGTPRARMGTRSTPPPTVEYLGRLQDKYLATHNVLRAIRVAENTEALLAMAQLHRHFYEARKREDAALDFTDLVGRTVELLTRRSSAAWVLFKLDGGIEHVLIDEAQDTAPEQWEIMRALTESFHAGEGVERDRGIERTVFVVGDEKQSIYSFQGARPERLRREGEHYKHRVINGGGQFKPVDLNTSFRSTKQVLDFVDATFKPYPDRVRALVGQIGDMTDHLPAREGQEGSVEMWPLFQDPPTEERKAWSAPVDQESGASGRKKLARALAREIRQQVAEGHAIWDFSKSRGPFRRPARYGDFLILVRRRDATFEEIIRALKMEAVPVAGADRLKLHEHIIFDDMLALARFALFCGDDLSLAEILRSPFCEVPDFGAPHDLFHLANKDVRGHQRLWEALCARKDEHPQWTDAHAFLTRLLEGREADPFTFFASALNHVFRDGRSGRARVLDRMGREAEEAMDETLAQVLAAEERGGRDLETCLHELEQSQVEVKREMEGARNEVRVMTVHGSKGLEAPVVILPDTTSRAKPQGPTLMPVPAGDAGEAWLMCPSSKDDDCTASAEARERRERHTDEESLRLLYVALTRARDRLIIMGRELGNNKNGFAEGSWWDILQQTFLAKVEAGAARAGPDGRIRIGEAARSLGPEARLSAVPVVVPDWALHPARSDAGARFASPSQMQDNRTIKRIPAPSPLAVASTGGRALGRFRRGDLIHRLLERLPDIAPDMRRQAAARLLSKEVDLDDAQRAEMIVSAFDVLDDERFAPVFGPGSRAEVALTGTAPELPAGVKINGQIDRLVITPQRVLVVDYKTNRPAPDRLEDVDPAYLMQLAVYAAVLRQLYPDRPVDAALVWTDGPRLMPVPTQVLIDALG